MKNRSFGLLILLLIFARCGNAPAKYIYNEGSIFGTIYHVVYESPEGKDFHDELKKKLNKYNKTFSTYDSTSVISKINNNHPVELNDWFLHCFRRSMEISKITGGAFDITTGPLVNAWGFGPEERKKMTPAIIDSLKNLTGYQKIAIRDGEIIKEHKNMKIDMSAVAKGYACDLLTAFLEEKGCRNYMAEIGGEVVALGTNEKGRVWTIGISKPEETAFFASGDLQAKVRLPAHALATSGNYRNFYVEEGQKFAHTINPATGYPVRHNLLSATVLANNCLDADAFATAFMVMGLEKSVEMAKQIPDIKIYLIYADQDGKNQVFFSEGFEEQLLN